MMVEFFMFSMVVTGACMLQDLLPKSLRRVGEDISEYFPPTCRPAWHPVWVFVLVLSTWLSPSEKIPFSRSVWLDIGDLTKLRVLGLGSVAVPLLQKLASRLELLERLEQRAVLVRLGLGKLRY